MSHPKWPHKKLERYVAEHGEEPTWRSVNDGIAKHECPVDFPRFDRVVDRILELGRGTWMAARDFTACKTPRGCLPAPVAATLLRNLYSWSVSSR